MRVNNDQDEPLTDPERQQLEDPETQERHRLEYLKQLRRLQCPGCGEADMF